MYWARSHNRRMGSFRWEASARQRRKRMSPRKWREISSKRLWCPHLLTAADVGYRDFLTTFLMIVAQAGRKGRLDFLCLVSVFAHKLGEPGAYEVADLSEGGGLAAAGEGGGGGETVMDGLAGAGKDGAGFAGVVADGDDVVELLADKFVDGL